MKTGVVVVPDGFVSTMTTVFEHEVHWLAGGPEDSPLQLVMIHGALATRRYLMPTAKVLAESIRVFIPEMPGHGASSKPALHALTAAQQAEVLFEWFRLTGLKRTNIFANSYGCQVAAHLVANHSEIVDSLILTGPTTDQNARNMPEQAFKLWIDGFGEPKDAGNQLHDDLSDIGIGRAFETVGRMLEDDIRPQLVRIKCRTLVLRGGKDTLATESWTKEVASCLANSRFCEIPMAPHCVNYAVPLELSGIVLDFIRQTDAAA